MKKQNSFVKAGATLALSGIVVKVLSAAYRIPLTRMLGASVMGRYSTVFNLFMPFFSFATAGVATCVAHFGAQYGEKGQFGGEFNLKKTAFRLYLSIAFVLSALFIIFAKFYSQHQDEPLLFIGCIILVPAIMLSAAENVFKGLTQAKMDMLPTASANVLESVFKTTVGLLGVWLVKEYYNGAKDDMAIVICLATITVSGMVCTVFLWFKSRGIGQDKPMLSQNRNGSFGAVSSTALLKMSAPIAVSALVISLTNFFDTAVCLPRIDKIPYTDIVRSFDGASFKGAGDMSMYLFGIWQGMVLTVFNLAPAVISSVGTAGMPAISKLWASKDKKRLEHYTQKLFATTAVLSVPIMAFVFCFGGDIMRLLFNTTEAQAVVGLQLLRILCTTGIFCCFNPAFNSVLYAAGKSDTVFKILLTACIAKAVSSGVLCTIPTVNIKAFAVSGGVFYTIIFMRSLSAVKKQGVVFNFTKIFFVPLAAATFSVLFVNWLAKAHLYSMPLFFKLLFTGLIYLLMYMLIIISTGFLVDK